MYVREVMVCKNGTGSLCALLLLCLSVCLAWHDGERWREMVDHGDGGNQRKEEEREREDRRKIAALHANEVGSQRQPPRANSTEFNSEPDNNQEEEEEEANKHARSSVIGYRLFAP